MIPSGALLFALIAAVLLAASLDQHPHGEQAIHGR